MELSLTLASGAKPGRYSSSGVVPSALAIRAPRPKNNRAELCIEHRIRRRRKAMHGRPTLSIAFGQFLDEHFACYQLRKASNISTSLHFLGASAKGRCIRDGIANLANFDRTSAICAPLCSLVFFETFVRDTTKFRQW